MYKAYLWLLWFINNKKWTNPGLFLFIFILFSLQFQYKLKKSNDGVLGIRTRGRRMVGADKTMELWRPPRFINNCLLITFEYLLYEPIPIYYYMLRVCLIWSNEKRDLTMAIVSPPDVSITIFNAFSNFGSDKGPTRNALVSQSTWSVEEAPAWVYERKFIGIRTKVYGYIKQQLIHLIKCQ